jgi:EmrB/QacA subfamily drug resistance transporter
MSTQHLDATTTKVRPSAVVIPALSYLMVTLDALVVVTALPSIRADLGGDPSGLQWVVNAYNLTFAAGIVAGAALGDRFGRRRVFIAGLAGFTLASAACALAPGLGLLVGFRALQGLAAAALAPVGLTLVTEAFPPGRRGAAVGLWGGIAGVGVAAGPLLGGAVTQGLDWHWVFWMNIPIGLVVIVACVRGLAESRGPTRPLDVPGMLLVGLALAALVNALVDAPRRGWSSSHTMVWLAGAAALAVAFVVWESTTAQPMMPMQLFGSQVFSAATLANLLSSGAIFSAAYITSEFFQLGRGDSPLGTGLRLLPWTVTPLLIAPLAGVWSDRFGARRLSVPGLVLQAAGFVWIVALAGSGASWGSYVVPFVIAGIGVSLALPSLPAAALGAVPPERIGVASGVVNVAQRVGSVVGVAVITAVFSAHGSLASPPAVATGFRWALAAAAVISLAGAAVAMGVRRVRIAG